MPAAPAQAFTLHLAWDNNSEKRATWWLPQSVSQGNPAPPHLFGQLLILAFRFFELRLTRKCVSHASGAVPHTSMTSAKVLQNVNTGHK